MVASIYAMSGDREGAQRRLGSVALQRDPRFQALLTEPKNNAPLF